QWVSVTDAGHTVHLEQLTPFVRVLGTWLSQTFDS
ncbi:MAG: hypothetical protein RL419_1895, partial [Actinomycetota bacterium]